MTNVLIKLTIIVTLFAASNSKAGSSLPDSLTTHCGDNVTTSAQWQKKRRPEILELFRENVYGRNPIDRPDDLRFETVEKTENALSGKTTLKRVKIHFSGPGGKGHINVNIFIPNDISKPVPGFLLICHRSKMSIDPTLQNKSSFWPVHEIVQRGYFAAAFQTSDIDPDMYDGFKNGVHGIFDPHDKPRSADAWGTIAAWAWGASRVMDYFQTDSDIDAGKVAVVGHSRGGKTALWCGAQDRRFAMTVSNNSGCTGAALARNKKGETIKKINDVFPHWFCANYKKFNDKEDELPVDQHELIALIAPRLVYVASASEDAWADPEGEFLSCVHAGPVYQLFDLQGVGATQMPGPQKPLHTGHIGYHIRTGKHNLTEYDWGRFMDFADHHWKRDEAQDNAPELYINSSQS